MVPAYLGIEVVSGASLGKWAVGLIVCRPDGTRASWLIRLVRWFVKSSPWLLATIDVTLVVLFEREVFRPMVEKLREMLGGAAEWCLSPLDSLTTWNWLQRWLLIPYVALPQLGIGSIFLPVILTGEFLLFTASRRTLIDRLSGTAVVPRKELRRGVGFEVLPGFPE